MINTNDIVRLKLEVNIKPLLSNIPHYYLCWNNALNTHSFFIFTSNLFKLLNSNLVDANHIEIFDPIPKLPFSKRTFLILSESYNIFNLNCNKKHFLLTNVFEKFMFDRYRSKGLSAKQFNITNYTLI